MTKSDLARGPARQRQSPGQSPAQRVPAQREGRGCELYTPGHQIHYLHQGDAVRSPARAVHNSFLDDSLLILVLADGSELRWRHHDPERLRRVLESVPGRRFVYPDFHALRVGPYWFNCAPAEDTWQDCRVLPE